MNRIVLVAVLISSVGCAGPRPDTEDPDLVAFEVEVTPEMIKELLDCPVGSAPLCLERMGEPVRCFCADRDAMRQVLEPDKYP